MNNEDIDKTLARINENLHLGSEELKDFGQTLFSIAKYHEVSFEKVANGAAELARQRLSLDKIIRRLGDALVLSRLTGLSSTDASIHLMAIETKFDNTPKSLNESMASLAFCANQASRSVEELIKLVEQLKKHTDPT